MYYRKVTVTNDPTLRVTQRPTNARLCLVAYYGVGLPTTIYVNGRTKNNRQASDQTDMGRLL